MTGVLFHRVICVNSAFCDCGVFNIVANNRPNQNIYIYICFWGNMFVWKNKFFFFFFFFFFDTEINQFYSGILGLQSILGTVKFSNILLTAL